MKTIRAHVEGCERALRVPVDLCPCGGRDFPESGEARAAQAPAAVENAADALLLRLEAIVGHTFEGALIPMSDAIRDALTAFAASRAPLSEPQAVCPHCGLSNGHLPACEYERFTSAEAAPLSEPQGVSCTVSDLRGGEDNDGPLESTDLFVQGRGIALLCNVEAGQKFTYSLSVDGQPRQAGTVGASAEAAPLPALVERAQRHVAERREVIAKTGNHSWEWDGKRAWGIICDLAALRVAAPQTSRAPLSEPQPNARAMFEAIAHRKDATADQLREMALAGAALASAEAAPRAMRYWVFRATDQEVGPVCSNIPVPRTIVMDDDFREPYVQGYRHALADMRRGLLELAAPQSTAKPNP